ncbi:MAG: AIPR family protein [Deltaproteobacteria bacterium]|nr:AIPR family protein [Deltaproteobacteria bacterium]MBI3295390.1 AIPR family protein [Deltaproteobacteria bacterium]
MAKRDLIHAQVTEYYKNNPIGRSADDAFAAWWISKTFQLSPLDANARSEGGGGNMGMDGFHLEEGSKTSTLHIVRAMMSDSRNDIKAALSGFERVMKEISPWLKGRTPDVTVENNALSRMVGALRDNPKAVRNLKVNFYVLHLSEEPTEILWNAFSTAKAKFDSLCRSLLGAHHVVLQLLGPSGISPTLSGGHVPAEAQDLTFETVQLPTDDSVDYFVGIGRLADLVRLYENYGDQLFSKNVRAFLYKSMEKGPARYMRETLRSICDKRIAKGDRIPAHNFAIFHNGVTLYTLSASVKKDKVEIREPSILNGCQTVKNAYLFKHNYLGDNIDEKTWEEIPVPLRIIVSSDEDLIRNVTVSNNRQSAIRASAFRSNDPVQLDLGERLRAMKVFYERQEGSFDNMRKSDGVRLTQDYENSLEGPLTMEELAQAVATAGVQPALSVATKISDLFEDAQYKRVFSTSHIHHLELLVFLRNLMKVVSLALRDIREESARLEGMSSSSFRFPAVRILARYIYRHEPNLIHEYGQSVINRFPPNHQLRTELKRIMRHTATGLQQMLVDVWYDPEKKAWRSPTDKDSIDSALRKLRLSDVDVFSK